MAKRITKDDFRPTPKKIRRRRKPMTEEQKAAAVERLRKAREAKAAANPAKPANVCDHVLSLPDDHYLSYVKVKGWIKANQEALTAPRADVRRDVKGARAKQAQIEGYLRNMKRYLAHGDWCDNFYGEHQEKKIQWVNLVPGYDKNGEIKRQHGVYYPDLGFRWGYPPEDDPVLDQILNLPEDEE